MNGVDSMVVDHSVNAGSNVQGTERKVHVMQGHYNVILTPTSTHHVIFITRHTYYNCDVYLGMNLIKMATPMSMSIGSNIRHRQEAL